MKELYRVESLTPETAQDALSLTEQAWGKYSPERRKNFIERIQIIHAEALQVKGAQHGCVVYEEEKPVGYLGVSFPLGDPLLMQHLGGMATDPDHRSFGLLKAMLNHVINTQKPGITYLYQGDAEIATSYNGLLKPGVQLWLRRHGYAVDLREPDPAKLEEGAQVLFYPREWEEMMKRNAADADLTRFETAV